MSNQIKFKDIRSYMLVIVETTNKRLKHAYRKKKHYLGFWGNVSKACDKHEVWDPTLGVCWKSRGKEVGAKGLRKSGPVWESNTESLREGGPSLLAFSKEACKVRPSINGPHVGTLVKLWANHVRV